MEKILDFQTREIPGEHARGNFRLLLSENETGINGMNAPIQLCGHGNTAGALFSGYPEKVEIKEEGRYRIADVQAVSGTILLDQKKCNRVFQKKAQTYMGIANTVTADTEHSACILPGSDMQTGGNVDTVSGNGLELPEKNGIPAWTSVSARHQLLLSPFLPWSAGRGEKGTGRNPVLRYVLRWALLCGQREMYR